jgi:hypothetical protein
VTFESVGNAVTATANTLKGNPLCLSLLVLVVVIMGFSTWRTVVAIRERNDVITTLIERCMDPAKR